MPARPRNVEKLWKNRAKPTSLPSSHTNRTSAFRFAKIHSRSSSSVATTWSVIFSYSARPRIKLRMTAQSFSVANLNVTLLFPSQSALILPGMAAFRILSYRIPEVKANKTKMFHGTMGPTLSAGSDQSSDTITTFVLRSTICL